MNKKLFCIDCGSRAARLFRRRLCEVAVSATTDLNVRAGPGPQHEIIGVIGAGQSAELDGCLEDSKWCVVAFEGAKAGSIPTI